MGSVPEFVAPAMLVAVQLTDAEATPDMSVTSAKKVTLQPEVRVDGLTIRFVIVGPVTSMIGGTVVGVAVMTGGTGRHCFINGSKNIPGTQVAVGVGTSVGGRVGVLVGRTG